MEARILALRLCGSLLGPVSGDKNYAAELTTQMAASGAAFMIGNPTKASDNLAVYTAGVEGALRAYESILKVKPKAKWPSLDELIEKRNRGELSEHVRQAAVRCK